MYSGVSLGPQMEPEFFSESIIFLGDKMYWFRVPTTREKLGISGDFINSGKSWKTQVTLVTSSKFPAEFICCTTHEHYCEQFYMVLVYKIH